MILDIGMYQPWGNEKCVRNSGRESQRKRPLGRRRHKFEDNIKLDLVDKGVTV